MSECWRLKEMTVKGFRGFVETQDFSFPEPLILLDGPQGSGKSSTLVAIEWCLFGDEITKKACGIDERRGWKVRNTNADEAHVEIVLQKDGDTLRVVRSDKRTKKGPQFYFELNNSLDTDEWKLRATIGVEPKDYFSSIHLHQEVIKALLIEEPRTRKDLVDRLLGLSELRNMVDAIRSVKISSYLKEADDDFSQIETKLYAVMASKRNDIEKEKEQGVQEGLSPKDFSETGARQKCKGVKKALLEFSTQAGLSIPELPSANMLDEQRYFATSARDTLRQLRGEQPDLKRQTKLLEDQLKLRELLTSYKETSTELQELEAERKNVRKTEGSREKILSRISRELNPKLEDARIRRNRIDKRAGTIDEAMEYFEAIQTPSGSELCPVCEKPIDDVRHLQTHLEELRDTLSEDLAPVRKEIDEYESEIRRLEELVESLDDLEEDIKDTQEGLDTCKSAIGAALDREIKDTEDPIVILKSELGGIESRLVELETAVKESNQKLNTIEDDILKLGHILTVIGLEADIANMLKITETEEYVEVVNRKSRLERFAAVVDIVRQAIEDVLEAGARAKLESTKDSIANMFKTLADRTDYSELRIDPDNFEILAAKGVESVPALSVLNEGDLNCAGLSVFLGLATSQDLCHDLGFIILDDPSQTLDAPHKENLVGVLNCMPEDKQILVSTSQPDLRDLILANIIRKKKHYKFVERSAAEGVGLEQV